MHYMPERQSIEIKVPENRMEETSEPFISVVIPANEVAEFSIAVRRIADDFEQINRKLKTAQQGAAGDGDKPPN
jgi:hypothetical protein